MGTINVVMLGSEKSGKSTIAGKLLYELNLIDKDKYESSKIY